MKYLRNYEQYKDSDDFEKALQWVAEHDERLSVEIVCQSVSGEQSDPLESSMLQVNGFLKEHGFVVLAQNQTDPSPDAPFEAWAYRGPLDFQIARPVTFGLGADIHETLEALNLKLSED